jgi:hypothetical protein
VKTIALADLVRVVGGGENTTTTTVGPFSSTTKTSDAELCKQAADELARRQYPDTRPFGLPIGTDGNAEARGQAARSNSEIMCGR